MENLYLDSKVLKLGLRAVKSVACADGEVSERERVLMRAAARAFTPSSQEAPDVDALETISPEVLAAALDDELLATRMVQVLLITALIDGEVVKEEYALIREFARALGVKDRRLKNLKQVLRDHTFLVKLDLNRHSTMINDVARHAYRQGGLKGVWKSMAPMVIKKAANDEELAGFYRRLGLLGEDTFGRQYWVHMRERGFAFPGEMGGFSEAFMKHDLCHVLGDYDTDHAGESEVVAFISGFSERDPFWYIFMVVLHVHLGIETFHGDPVAHLAFEPVPILAALNRGRQVNTDLYALDFEWRPLLELPIEEVRARFNILPKS